MTSLSLFRGGPSRAPLVLLRAAAFVGAALLTGTVFGLVSRASTPPPQPPQPGLIKVDETGTGSLLLKTTVPGQFLEAPRLKTDVAVTVTGPIARTRITQRFENPSDKWVEGIYVYPLPQNSGVDSLKMMVGERFLEGRVKEREEARQIYEKAKAEGFKAALMEQQRPNIFTNSVANIGPRETIVVQIEYQETVRLDGDTFSLRVPLVVGPRYTPKPRVALVGVSTENPMIAVSDPVPDRHEITPPVIHPKYGKINPVTLTVTLRSGVALSQIASFYHPIDIQRFDPGTANVTVKGPVPADRDFVLNWKLAPITAPQARLFRETIGGQHYYLAMITPPVGAGARERTPREAIFVIDNSGSMAGESMRQAKQALALALSKLRPEDRFNVIRFDDTYDVLFKDTVPADQSNVAHAMRYVLSLDANGGTEIHAALKAALADPRPTDTSRLRQVIFLTDGAVGNEDEVLNEIGRSLGRSRLFTIGIGSAPNSFLMEHIAQMGRGTFTHIGSEAEVEARVGELFAKLESPVMTDLKVTTAGANIEAWPNPVPDLYAGEPLVLTAATNARSGVIKVDGRVGATPWSATLDLASAVEGYGVSKLWARAKISALDALRYRGVPEEQIDKAVLSVALAHHLVSRRTSLVAVDVTPSRPTGQRLDSHEMPTNLPHGWNFEKVFGEDPEYPTIKAEVDPRMLQKLAMADKPVTDASGQGVMLPQTDAGTDLQLLAGLLLILTGLTLLYIYRPRSARA